MDVLCLYLGMAESRSLTVSEVVDRCAPANDELQTIWLRRLRDWSSVGLLDVDARHREGSGRHRLYSPDAVYVAAVLLRMADLGVPIGTLTPIARLIQRPKRTAPERAFRRFWSDAQKVPEDSGAHAYLAIRQVPSQESTYYRHGWGPMQIVDDAAWVIINLSRVFANIKRA
jgi:DNA-binding transcriptional MerR regulator